MRDAIAASAVACDYQRLEDLALAGEPGFTYSFGDGGSPASFWKQAESEGEEVLGLLVRTLNLPHVTAERQRSADDQRQVTQYVWPSVHREGATDVDWKAVQPLYGNEAIDEMRRRASGFLGYRIAITEDGDWTFFVAGD
jgi:hypothetical protein